MGTEILTEVRRTWRLDRHGERERVSRSRRERLLKASRNVPNYDAVRMQAQRVQAVGPA